MTHIVRLDILGGAVEDVLIEDGNYSVRRNGEEYKCSKEHAALIASQASCGYVKTDVLDAQGFAELFVAE